MDQKLVVSLEVEKEGKTFIYHMPFGSTFQAAYDATVELGQQIVELSKKSEEEKKKQAESELVEEAK